MKHLRPAILLTAFFVVATGLVFPVVVWALGHLLFPSQASGSLLSDAHGKVFGSVLLGQSFSRPEYFHPRPSAAGTGYDASNSGGTNLGPTSHKLVFGVEDDPATKDVDERFAGFTTLARAYREENGLPIDAMVPADAVTRSASGLDPHISPANAALQIPRVAAARGTSVERVRAVVTRYTEPRSLGFLGEPRVNVLMLNHALDEALESPYAVLP
jgi:K+-transporting ATPase ATPase C chain